MAYTVSVPYSKTAKASAVYRNKDAADGSWTPPVWTLYENFQLGLSASPNGPCLGHRSIIDNGNKPGPYVWQTYSEVNQRFTKIGSGLIHIKTKLIGGQKKTKWHLGIYSVNRPEWVIAEQACNAYSLVNVALYDTLGSDTLQFCINHAELSIIVCSYDKISVLLKNAYKCPALKVIISMDPINSDATSKLLRDWSADRGILLFGFDEVEKLGEQFPHKHIPPKPEDLATICYTSGTTGNPKGAMLPHRSFVSAGFSVSLHRVKFTSADVMISYLPLAHCFERVLQTAMYGQGGSVGFYRGDVLLLLEDIAALKPTFFPSVPRLFNRIYSKLVEGTTKAPGIRGALFRQAFSAKLASIKSGGDVHHWFWDRLLFKKVAGLLGGRVRLMITGSAPISGDILQFLRIAFCCEILEGYGQTEAAAGTCLTFPGDYVTSQVGVPIACNEIRLVDVPDMGYLSTDKNPKGEVCIRGMNVMLGYFKDEAKTAETIDEDGWLYTGDIGMITDQGTLAIIDRKKNIFKLAQGEYVAPEKLEAIYIKSDAIMQCLVHGDSLQSQLVGVVVLNPEKVVGWLRRRGVQAEILDKGLAEISRDGSVKKFLLEEIERIGKQYKLQGFELLKNIHIEPEQWTVENNLLTPSFKLKRNEASKKYRKEIDRMYAELNASTPPSKL